MRSYVVPNARAASVDWLLAEIYYECMCLGSVLQRNTNSNFKCIVNNAHDARETNLRPVRELDATSGQHNLIAYGRAYQLCLQLFIERIGKMGVIEMCEC